jgi:hypothetical protein
MGLAMKESTCLSLRPFRSKRPPSSSEPTCSICGTRRLFANPNNNSSGGGPTKQRWPDCSFARSASRVRVSTIDAVNRPSRCRDVDVFNGFSNKPPMLHGERRCQVGRGFNSHSVARGEWDCHCVWENVSKGFDRHLKAEVFPKRARGPIGTGKFRHSEKSPAQSVKLS